MLVHRVAIARGRRGDRAAYRQTGRDLHQAAIWAALLALGITAPIAGYGRLLGELDKARAAA